jgi:hypothetical protein
MAVLAFIAVVIAGWLGILGHWYNRWVDGRTSSNFWQYLAVHKARTISSCISTFASSAATYQFAPPDLSMMVMLSAFSFGYMLDSVVNKDKPMSLPSVNDEKVAETVAEKIIKEVRDEQKDKSLDDLLADDRKL